MPLTVVLLGPPASGKGTQAARLARARGLLQVSTGDILREAAVGGSELGRRAGALIDRGELVGDEEMVDIVTERLARPDAAGGSVLDGFPRTVPQARALDQMLGQPPVLIDLRVPDAELLCRMEKRRICSRCAAIAEPGASDLAACARCGGAMARRADDGDGQVRRRRLEVYARESRPLLDDYRARPTFRSIDGVGTPDRVAQEMAAAIEAIAALASGGRR